MLFVFLILALFSSTTTTCSLEGRTKAIQKEKKIVRQEAGRLALDALLKSKTHPYDFVFNEELKKAGSMTRSKANTVCDSLLDLQETER